MRLPGITAHPVIVISVRVEFSAAEKHTNLQFAIISDFALEAAQRELKTNSIVDLRWRTACVAFESEPADYTQQLLTISVTRYVGVLSPALLTRRWS